MGFFYAYSCHIACHIACHVGIALTQWGRGFACHNACHISCHEGIKQKTIMLTSPKCPLGRWLKKKERKKKTQIERGESALKKKRKTP